MLTRRAFSAGLGPAALTARARGRKLNLLFLVADDHAAYVMGADGNKAARTPHMDRLAAEGTRFASHYCNSPVCTPSRQSLLSGQMPHSAGVTRLHTPLDESKPTLAKQLKAAGYRTGVFGKMHFNRPGAAGLHGFDICQTEDVIAKRWREEIKPSPLPEGAQTKPMPWRPFQTPAAEWLNAARLPFPRLDAGMRGTFIADQAGRFLAESKNDPFALWVSFHEPHSPFDFPVGEPWTADPGPMPLPRIGPEDAGQIPLIFRELTAEQRRGIAAAYYTSVHFLDRNIGRVLARLRELKLENDTLVVYTADHGYCLGHHGRFEKHCGYDPALRVPLILRLPGAAPGRTVRDFTEHLDLGPTLLELLGAPAFDEAHGQSLAPYLRGDKPEEPRTHVVSEYLENEEIFVRTERWKLIYCTGRRKRQDGYATDNPTPGRTVRLFDLKADPGEFINVAKRQPRVVSELEELALERIRNTHPESASEPRNTGAEAALDFYLRPRDPDPVGRPGY